MGFWRKSELLVLELSQTNRLPSGELKERLFDKYEEIHNAGSELARNKENRNTKCGSCIRRVRTAVMRHFQRYEWQDNGRLVLRTIDTLDKRPIYVKAEK